GNKYLADSEPWKLIKTDEERVKTVLNVSLQLAANLAILAQPFLPHTAKRMFTMLNISDRNWADAGSTALLTPGHQLGEAQLLFEKITDEQVDAQLAKLSKAKETTVPPVREVPEAKVISFLRTLCGWISGQVEYLQLRRWPRPKNCSN